MARWREYGMMTCLLGVVAVTLPAASLWQMNGKVDTRSELYLVIGAPQNRLTSATRTLDLKQVAGANAPLAVLVQSTHAARIIRAQSGAWMVVPAGSLGFLCTSVNTEVTS